MSMPNDSSKETVANQKTVAQAPPQTVVAESVGASARGAAEAAVAVEWKAGDVILDTYEVKQVHEGGGMGLVYRVHHKGWNLDLAVKSPRAEYFQSETQKENFIRECETWINLGLHPHIVSCHYVRTLGGVPRVFAEYVVGGSLKDWIDSRKLYEDGPQEALKRVLDISIQFAWGLQYAHEKGLIHQDVKPANVLMTPDGTAKVTDFGLAKARATAGEALAGDKQKSILVSTGGMTPAYCSPEQANKEPLSRKTDIWSWAVSVLEMFVGEVCWQSGVAAPEVLEKLKELRSTDVDLPKLPESFRKLLQDCFRLTPEREWPKDMAEVVARLKAVYRDHEVAGEDYGREQPKAAELLADALNNRALSMLDLGKKEEAEKLFEEALKSDPHHPEATYNRGLILWRSGRVTDDALVRQLEEVRKTHPEDWRDDYLLALVHLERGDAETAVIVLEGIMGKTGLADRVEAALAKARSRVQTSGRCVRTFEGHKKDVYSVCLSADGRQALSGSSDETLRQWDVASGRCLQILKVGTDKKAAPIVIGPGELLIPPKNEEGKMPSISSVALSNHGRYALSGGLDGELKHWEVVSNRCLRSFKADAIPIGGVCLSADGRYALSKSWDKTLRLWEVTTGHCLRTFKVNSESVGALSLSVDGRYTLLGSGDERIGDKTLKLWELTSGRCLRTFEGHSRRVSCVCLSADGRYALAGTRDRTLELWELVSGRCLRTFGGHTDVVGCVCLSVDGRYALAGTMDGTIKRWEVTSGRCLRTFEGHTGGVLSVCLSTDGRYALSGGEDRTVKIWRVTFKQEYNAPLELAAPESSTSAGGTQSRFFKYLEEAKQALNRGNGVQAATAITHARELPGYRRHPAALEVLSTLCSKLPKRTLAAGWEERTFEGHASVVNSICLSADGRHALSGSGDKTLKLWELASGRCLRTFEGHNEGVSCVCLSVDGRYALSGSYDQTLRLWEVACGRCVRTFTGHVVAVSAGCLSADGRYALSAVMGSTDEALKIWEVATGCCLRTLKQEGGSVTALCLSADGRYALSGSADRTLNLWEVASGRRVHILKGNGESADALCLSADGRYALSGSGDKSLKLWELASGRCLRTFEGHNKGVSCVCLSADGRYALSGSWDKTLRLWEVTSGRCLRTFEGHGGEVRSVCLSADGRYALSGSGDATLKLWALDWELENKEPADWDEEARHHLVNFLTLHTPYISTDPSHPEFLVRRGQPTWTEEDWQGLLYTLGCAGYGWLRPEGVKRELEKMASEWQGPPPLPWESPVTQSPAPAAQELKVNVEEVPRAETQKPAQAVQTVVATEDSSAATLPATVPAKASPPPPPQPQQPSVRASPFRCSRWGRRAASVKDLDADVLRSVIRRRGEESSVLRRVLFGKDNRSQMVEARFIYDQYVKALPFRTDPPEFFEFMLKLPDMVDRSSCRLREAKPAEAPAAPGVRVPEGSSDVLVCGCGAPNTRENKFCVKCGRPLPQGRPGICPKCGAPAKVPETAFCTHCGAKMEGG